MDKPRIILVDDELSNLLAMEQALEGLGFDIEKSGSSTEALSLIANHPVHCAVLDVDMPGIDGIEFAQMVRQDPKIKDTPILFVTGKVFSINQVARAYDAGAFDYLTKPLDTAAVRSKVEVLVASAVWKERYHHLRRASSDLVELLEQSLLETSQGPIQHQTEVLRAVLAESKIEERSR